MDADGRAATVPVTGASTEASGASRGSRPDRRRDLDRLRILACFSTFCYHAVQVFDLNPYYHLKSNTLSPGIDVAARLLHAVRMPLFFLIAGMVAVMALKRASDRAFMRQRAVRLLVPFVFGIVLITPWVKYLELTDGRSINWLGQIVQPIKPPPLFLWRYFTQLKWFSWSHMWFPLYLFLLSGALLPVMRRMAGRDWPARLPMTAALGLPLLALIGIELTLRPFFPHHVPNLVLDWASMAVYVTALISGAALARWPDLELALRRARPALVVAGALGIALYLDLFGFGGAGLGGTTFGLADWPMRGIGRAMTLWSLAGFLISLAPWTGRGRLAGEGYFSDAVLPLYVLHHVPLLLIAMAVKDQPWPIWQRYGLIVFGAFVITLAIYHLLVRPFDLVRRAFGMPAAGGKR